MLNEMIPEIRKNFCNFSLFEFSMTIKYTNNKRTIFSSILEKISKYMQSDNSCASFTLGILMFWLTPYMAVTAVLFYDSIKGDSAEKTTEVSEVSETTTPNE